MERSSSCFTGIAGDGSLFHGQGRCGSGVVAEEAEDDARHGRHVDLVAVRAPGVAAGHDEGRAARLQTRRAAVRAAHQLRLERDRLRRRVEE
jgi:hypothetical protein